MMIGAAFEKQMKEDQKEHEVLLTLSEHYDILKNAFEVEGILLGEELKCYLGHPNPNWQNFSVSVVCHGVERFRRVWNLSQERSEKEIELNNFFIDIIGYKTFLSFARVCAEHACNNGVDECLKYARDFILRNAPEGFGKRNGLPKGHPFLDCWYEYSDESEDIRDILEFELEKARIAKDNSVGTLLGDALRSSGNTLKLVV